MLKRPAILQKECESFMDEMQTETNSPNNSNNPYVAPGADMAVAIDDGKPVLASLEKRLGAAIIDGIISSALVLLPMILFFGGWGKYLVGVQRLGTFGIAIGIAIATAVYVLVNGRFLIKNGQTVGKKLLGIKIVRTDGSAVDLKRVVLYRYLPIQLSLLVPVIGNFLSLIDALFIFRASRQCIHDQIADTIVIKA